jgi:predicted Zn-dependent protease
MILRRRAYTFGMKWLICVFGISLTAQTVNVEKERALGAGLVDSIRREAKPLGDAEVSAFVERVGRKLSAILPDSDFRFEVVVSDGAEPIGLPGGFVLVPASFLLAAEDEAEFAGMLAHAMGHSHLRHGFSSIRQTQDGKIPLLFMGGWAGVHANTQQRQMLFPQGFLASLRKFELEADRFALDLTGKAGYDPGGLVRYVRRVQPADSGSPSPLPPKEERLAALEGLTAQGAVDGGEFRRVRGLVGAALAVPVRKAPSLRR